MAAATETGSIEIILEETGEKIQKEGITFQYSKVASVIDGAYEMETGYEQIDLNKIQYARELEQAARKLSQYRYSDGICRTDKEGKASLTNLKEGVYLIYASDETQSEVQPVLVQLPKWEEEEGTMQWKVQVCPKITRQENAVRTGDAQQAAGWVFVCLCSGVLALVAARR